MSSEKPKGTANLNAITRLQAEAMPVIEAKNANDGESTKAVKRRPKKKKSRKGKKKVVGTKDDPVTIKEIDENSDDSSLSDFTQNRPKVIHKQAPKELRKVVGKQVTKESPKVVDLQMPKAPPQKKTNINKPGVYQVPNKENHKLKEAIHLTNESQVVKQPNSKPTQSATPTTICKPPQTGKPLQIPSVISEGSEEEHDAQKMVQRYVGAQ